jgi:hypothetical protein
MNLDSPSEDGCPYFSEAEGALYFDSNRNQGFRIYRAPYAPGGAPGQVAEVSELSITQNAICPVLSTDALTIYWNSKPSGKSPTGLDIWTATRPALNAPFASLQQVPSLNSAADDYPNWISPDGCRLYMTSDRGGMYEPYVASRPAN